MYKAAICAIVKDEGRYIREWLAYHNAIGFEHFYIYDNESTDDTRQALEAAARAGICTVSTWENRAGGRAQLDAYKDGLERCRGHAEWLLYLDADEFLNLKQHRSITAFLANYEHADAVGINWRMFGDGGETVYRPGLLMDRFSLAAPEAFGANHLIKTIAKVTSILEPHIHTHKLRESAIFMSPEGVPLKHLPSARQDQVSWHIAQVNHYFTKTREEWDIKRARGKADLPPEHPDRVRPEGEFAHNNRNDELDDSILLWRDDTVRRILQLFSHV